MFNSKASIITAMSLHRLQEKQNFKALCQSPFTDYSAEAVLKYGSLSLDPLWLARIVITLLCFPDNCKCRMGEELINQRENICWLIHTDHITINFRFLRVTISYSSSTHALLEHFTFYPYGLLGIKRLQSLKFTLLSWPKYTIHIHLSMHPSIYPVPGLVWNKHMMPNTTVKYFRIEKISNKSPDIFFYLPQPLQGDAPKNSPLW